MIVPTLLPRDANKALNDNPANAYYHISTSASDWLWAAFSFISLCFLLMTALAMTRPKGKRTFHHIGMMVLITTSLAYFSMASDLGATPVVTEFGGNHYTRQIWYVRYIQWFITFPLLLTELLLVTGVTLSDILMTVFAAITLVITGLVGASVPSTYKWGYYTFGCVAMIFIWWNLLAYAPRRTFVEEGALKKGYVFSSCYLSFVLITYPICWACSEGANVITPTSEMIWYGILDIIAGPLFLFSFLYFMRNVEYQSFGLSSGKYTDVNACAVHPKEAEAEGH